MKASLIEFEKGIKSLTHNLHSFKLESELIKLPFSSKPPGTIIHSPLLKYQKHHKKFGSFKKKYNYNSTIVSLYGYFETFVESLIEGYLDQVNQCTYYFNQLPNPIKKNHLNLSIELLNKIQQTNYKGYLRERHVVSNLNSCINKTNFKLNKEAFSIHGANFRRSNIDELFSRIGITGITSKVINTNPFSSCLTKMFPERNLTDVSLDEKFDILNNLASRRNDVAHGVISDLLNPEIQQEYINYIYRFGVSLFKEVYRRFLRIYFSRKGKLLGLPNDVFKKGRVVCVDIDAGTDVKIGDRILAINETSIVKAVIIGIMEDNTSINSILVHNKLELGFFLDRKIGKNHRIKIYRNKIP